MCKISEMNLETAKYYGYVMIKEFELNKAYAEKLSILMANHPDMRVIVRN